MVYLYTCLPNSLHELNCKSRSTHMQTERFGFFSHNEVFRCQVDLDRHHPPARLGALWKQILR